MKLPTSGFADGQPRSIGKYEILQTVAVHKKTVVFKARDPDLDRLVALKIFHGELSDASKETVISEGRAHAKIACPFVTGCHSVESISGSPALVNEWVVGETLDEYARKRQVSFDEVRSLFQKIVKGIDAIHQAGLLHRDIKPTNIIVSDSGEPKIIDLGLSHPVSEENIQLAGTSAYMPPEVACGNVDEIGITTDIFGIGGVLYFLLSGQPLYEGDSKTSTYELARDCTHIPIRKLDPAVPEDLAAICSNCLQEQPTDRLSNTNEILTQLSKKSQPLTTPILVAVTLIAIIGTTLYLNGFLVGTETASNDHSANPGQSLASLKPNEAPAGNSNLHTEATPATPPPRNSAAEAAPKPHGKNKAAMEKMNRQELMYFHVANGDYEDALGIADASLQELNTFLAQMERQVMKPSHRISQVQNQIRMIYDWCVKICLLNRLDRSEAIKYCNRRKNFEANCGYKQGIEEAKIVKQEIVAVDKSLQGDARRQFIEAQIFLTHAEIENLFQNIPPSEAANRFIQGRDQLEELFGKSENDNLFILEANELLMNVSRFTGQKTDAMPLLNKLENGYKKLFGRSYSKLYWLHQKKTTLLLERGEINAAFAEQAKWKTSALDVFAEHDVHRQLPNITFGKLLSLQNLHERAIQKLSEVDQTFVENSPKHLYHGQAKLELARALTNAGRLDKAEDALSAATAIFENNMELGRVPKNNYEDAFALSAELKTKQGNPKEAIAMYKRQMESGHWARLVGTRPYARILFLQAQAYHQDNQLQEAIATIGEAIKTTEVYSKKLQLPEEEIHQQIAFESTALLLFKARLQSDSEDWNSLKQTSEQIGVHMKTLSQKPKKLQIILPKTQQFNNFLSDKKFDTADAVSPGLRTFYEELIQEMNLNIKKPSVYD